MKLKSILLTAAATLGLTAATMAQVPNYVPTNGLVGYWPFNGNANDESGNSNNLNNNGAALTSDRLNISNKAFSFTGQSGDGITGTYMTIPNLAVNQMNSFTINIWVFESSVLGDGEAYITFGDTYPGGAIEISRDGYSLPSGAGVLRFNYGNLASNMITAGTGFQNQWIMCTMTKNNNELKAYINGNLIGTINNLSAVTISPTGNYLARHTWGTGPLQTSTRFNGKLDDFGLWNRALTQQEVTALYNASNCANNTAITPQTNSLSTGSTATFTASTTDPNPSYVWQSDFGQGFQTLYNFGNYSGANTASLNIANVQLQNHTQPIRAISTSGNCIDTSNIAVISILDTCIVTVYDTLLTTVTDTLIINATLTGINPPSNLNTLKVYPNPANTHITIDYGNFVSMNGYTLKIVNAVGQTVFTTLINQQTSYIDLSTWTGNGIYFVQLIDTQNNTIENRKIIIQ